MFCTASTLSPSFRTVLHLAVKCYWPPRLGSCIGALPVNRPAISFGAALAAPNSTPGRHNIISRQRAPSLADRTPAASTPPLRALARSALRSARAAPTNFAPPLLAALAAKFAPSATAQRVDTPTPPAGLAAWINPIVASWMNYYGRFYRSRLHPLLARSSRS